MNRTFIKDEPFLSALSQNYLNNFAFSFRKFNYLKRFFYSNNVLKFLNLFLIFLLLINYSKIQIIIDEWKIYFNSCNINVDSNEIIWENIDILNPPKLANSLLEIGRINEFLAHGSIHSCKKKILIGGKSDSFILCIDKTIKLFKKNSFNVSSDSSTFRNAILITNQDYINGDFEQKLSVDRWVLFVPVESSIVDLFSGDVEINYIFNNEDDSKMETMLNEIKEKIDSTIFSILKLNLVNNACKKMNKKCRLWNVLLQILKHVKTNQILLTITIDKRKPDEIYEWYRVFYEIYNLYKFTILNAQSNSGCFIASEYSTFCEYRITFIKAINEEAPPFGLGTPMEEKCRLLKYLQIKHQITKNNKALIMNKELKLLILIDDFELPQPFQYYFSLNNPKGSNVQCGSLIYFRYRQIKSNKELKLIQNSYKMFCEKIFIFYPQTINFKMDLLKSQALLPFGISHTNKSNNLTFNNFFNSETWNLNLFNNLIQNITIKSYQHNILILDLDGEEWNLISSIHISDVSHNCKLIRKFEQILIRIRIWAIEESFNYKDVYEKLNEFENQCDFHIVNTFQNTQSVIYILFFRQQLVI